MTLTKRRRFEHLDINKLRLWKEGNVRKENVTQNLDELVGNIKENGLQVPLLVKKNRDQYLVFSGQRRFLACAKADIRNIPCFVFEDIDINDARILSLSENLYRLAMEPRDKSRTCKALLMKYGDKKKVAMALGVNVQTVKKYLGFDAFPNEIKRLIGEKKLTYAQAIKIYTKLADEKKALDVARELAAIPKEERKRKQSFFAAVSRAKPTDSVGDIRKKATRIEESIEYRLLLPAQKSQTLEKVASVRFVEKEDIALDFLMERIDMYERGEWGD